VLVQRNAAAGDCLAESLGIDRALSVAADVGDPDSAETIVKATIARWNRLDILVNNAALVPPRHDMLELSRELFESVLAVNLIGLALLSPGRRAPHASAALRTHYQYAGDPGALTVAAQRGICRVQRRR
jgi:NAD(P)-dependent dehydrogenase (short-subunit alcohol dehydrogenase family)